MKVTLTKMRPELKVALEETEKMNIKLAAD
jgi:hypothetical protein